MTEPETSKPAENSGISLNTEPTNQLLSNQGARIDKLEEKLKEITDGFEKRLITDKASLITVFGIFASIVTFLSVEIQAFKNICDPVKLLGFSVIILASLLSFVFVLHLIANFWINEKVKDYPKLLLLCIFLLFIAGGSMFFIGKDEYYCKENFIFERYSDDFNSKQVDLENQLNTKIDTFEKSYGTKMQEFNNRLDSIPKK